MMHEYCPFFDYLVKYPRKNRDGYDGIHNGGIKGIKKSASIEDKKEFKKYVDFIHDNKLEGWALLEYQEVDD